jgi:TonB family protein
MAAEPTAESGGGPARSTESVPSGVEGLGTGSGGGGGSAGASGPDLTALHQRLAEAAQSCYPAAARRLRLSGQLELAFCASADGRASNPSLGFSSGSELLDRAALDCLLDRAAPLPVRSGCFRVPVRFGMP